MRAIVIVLDSLGIGSLPDANKYGDAGCNTLKSCVDKAKVKLPNMKKLGLFNIDGCDYEEKESFPTSVYARAKELSAGKDTTTGHWELAGQVVETPFPTFPNGFPEHIIAELSKRCKRSVIGNVAASGTEIIDRLGREHEETGALIVYTSADSVLQIAAHIDVVPLDELYNDCLIARDIMQGDYAVGRIIARPFYTENGKYKRSEKRRDYSLKPDDIVNSYIVQAGLECVGIGKMEDIYAGRGITLSLSQKGNEACVENLKKQLTRDFDGLILCNLVDFDSLYGHRRDVKGYAEALQKFDNEIPNIIALLKEDDMLIITADHGCDPCWKGTDHTREYIPVMCYAKNIVSKNKGTVTGFGCVGATVAKWLGIDYRLSGKSLI